MEYALRNTVLQISHAGASQLDQHPKSPTYFQELVEQICEKLQNEKGLFEPAYEYLELGTLADPGHRCRNFGKDMKVLEKAKLSESLIMEEICTRIIKSFKYWYKSAVGKEFEEIKKDRHVPLLHSCGDHSLGDVSWCYALKARQNGDPYSEPITNLIPGTHDKEISQVLK